MEGARREGGRRRTSSRPRPATTLALVGGELKKDSPLAKAVAATGDVLIWDVQSSAIHKWIAEQFAAARREGRARPHAARLSELVGDDLYELASEVDKLATWAAGDEVTDADVDLLVAPRAESPPFNADRRVGGRDVGGVLRAAERMLDRTGDPRVAHDPAPRRQPHEPRRARRAVPPPRGGRARPRTRRRGSAARRSTSQKLYAQARNFSAGELRCRLVRLAELDHALKGGSRLANELELERALVEITQPQRRARR